MSSPLALLLLAAATPLWSATGVARFRLAVATGVEPERTPRWLSRPRRWAGDGSARLLPAVFGTSVGALLATLCGLPRGVPVGLAAGVLAWLGVRRLRRAGRARTRSSADELGLAGGWDLLAACLRAGLPVPVAVVAVSEDLPRSAADALRATADLLALGADPVAAWAPALECPATAALARGARRTARSGTALAGIATGLAASIRGRAGDDAEARAQRAGVLITGPLGLCFLPAFVCLGIVPVVIGLAAQLSVHP
ncbi:MAG: type II secretion system F family protein [Labedaea sp.]